MITSTPETIAAYEAAGLWEGKLLHQFLQVCVDNHPERVAVMDQPNRGELMAGEVLCLTYQQLHCASNNLAVQLLEAGIAKGDRVIVQLPNVVELVVSYLALSKVGAIISPIPVQYGVHELAHISDTLKARAYLSTPAIKGEAFAAPRVESLSESVVPLLWGSQLNLDTSESSAAATTLKQHQEHNPISANDIVTVCWTSGTTGTPKGVPRSHNMWVTVGRNCIEAGDYQQGDRLLNPFPLVNMASVGSFLYPFVMLGCTLVLHHPFEPAVFLQQIQSEKINFTIVPPAMLNQLAKKPEMWQQFDFSELRSIGSGSAPLAPWMIEQFDNHYGKKIVNFYGSNEGINLFSKPETAPDAETRASMFPRFGCDAVQWQVGADKTIKTKVMDVASGAEITEAGIPGELVISGPTVFDGYYSQEADTTPGVKRQGVFTEDGFFLTGDLVEICGEGNRFYRIVGRSKDIINRGGMKLSPVEIDVLLEGLPGSREAAVCAYPDSVLGEKVCACVVPEDASSPPTLEQVVAHLADKGLAKIKLPERLEIFDTLPRNPLGKVQRFQLQEQVSA